MTTVNELIAKVMDDTVRQDLGDRLLAEFPNALRCAHSIGTLVRDRKTLNLKDPVILNSITNLSLLTDLPKLRKILNIQAYSSYTMNGLIVVPGTEIIPTNFTDLTGANSQFNYYGFSYVQSFILLGTTLTLKGVDTSTKALGVTGQFWPSYALNVLSGEYETDSWLMLEFPEIVEAYLRLYVAKTTVDKDKLQVENMNIQQTKLQFMQAYPQELAL